MSGVSAIFAFVCFCSMTPISHIIYHDMQVGKRRNPLIYFSVVFYMVWGCGFIFTLSFSATHLVMAALAAACFVWCAKSISPLVATELPIDHMTHIFFKKYPPEKPEDYFYLWWSVLAFCMLPWVPYLIPKD